VLEGLQVFVVSNPKWQKKVALSLIVKKVMVMEFTFNPTSVRIQLRLFFHDYFVQGCDFGKTLCVIFKTLLGFSSNDVAHWYIFKDVVCR
jgi:hypothetical protein